MLLVALRLFIFLLIVLCVFLPFNYLVWRQLTRLHPRRRSIVLALIVAANLLWPFVPLLQMLTSSSRLARAILGPLWFSWTSFAVLYSILTGIVVLVWLPFRRRWTFDQFARPVSRSFLWLVLIGGLGGFYQATIPLRVERVPVAIANLPQQLEGTKIVLIGDLHVGLFTRPGRLQKIFATAQSLDPDLVLLAGDMIDDDPFYVPKLLQGTRALAPSIPLLAVLGNHEMYGDPRAVAEKLRGSRIRLLQNEGALHGGLWIAGVTDYAAAQFPDRTPKPDLAKALAGKPADALAIALAHQPRVFAEARKHAVPLALCAHTHGGQLGFRPFRWSLAGVFLPYHMGLYAADASQLYVNTGTGYWMMPFRLGMTPEITLLELHPGWPDPITINRPIHDHP